MFKLYFPFELPESNKISLTDEPISLNGLEFSLSKNTRYYALNVKGFESEKEAGVFLANVWAGMTSLLLNMGIPATYQTELRYVAKSDNPKEAAENLKFEGEVHGVIDGAFPAIYESEGTYKTLTAGNVTLTIGNTSEQFFDSFFNGAINVQSLRLFNNEKLRTAVDLYRMHFVESTQNAKFLTLVMVLETLMEPVERPKLVQDFLDEFRKKVEESSQTVEQGSSEWSSFDDLKREFTFRKSDSLRTQIYNLVLNTLEANPNVQELARNAKKIYDKRSKLVHDGKLEEVVLNSVCQEAKELVELILKEKLKALPDE